LGIRPLNEPEPAHFVSLDSDQFAKEATGIVENAKSRGIVLRILGALAVYVHSLDRPDCIQAHTTFQRNGEGKPMFTDLDLIAYKKQRKDVVKLLQDSGFKADSMVNWFFGDKMMVYEHPESKLHVDVFFNKLEYSHDVVFGEKPGSGRLEIDSPTIAPSDIVLEKLQPHQMGRKDALDLIVLFMGHDVGEQDGKETIDGVYVGSVLSDDWGFWYDVTTNLVKVRDLTNELLTQNKITREQSDRVKKAVDELSKRIDSSPKSKKWKAREKDGVSKPWFRPVEELMPS